MENVKLYTTANLPDKYEYKGFVTACTVRARNFFSAFGSGLKSLAGGQLKGQTKLIIATRNEVLNEIISQAQSIGANAIYGIRVDSDMILDGFLQFVAIGTAVRI